MNTKTMKLAKLHVDYLKCIFNYYGLTKYIAGQVTGKTK